MLRSRGRRFILLGGLITLLGGCLLHGGGKPEWMDDAEKEFGEPNDPNITLEITNQNFYDANVHALLGGQRRRLGSVRSQDAETFTFAWSHTELRVAVHLVGASRDRFSPSYGVGPGDLIRMVIDPEGRVYRTR